MTDSADPKRSGASDRGPFKEIVPPDDWKRKIVKGRGLDLGAIEARARAAIDRLRDDYVACARQELAQVDAAIAGARSGSRSTRDEKLRLVRRIAHDMRGQAETFGYPLITTIGTSLCDYVEGTDNPDSIQLDVIEIHANAMQAVIAGDIKGDGGKTGEKLLNGMKKMVAKTLA